MFGVLPGFLNDLLHRCRRLKKEVVDRGVLPPEVTDYRDDVVLWLEGIERQIEGLLQDPDIQIPALARNYLHGYKRLAEHVRTLEWRSVLALLRYADRDRLATRICQSMVRESP